VIVERSQLGAYLMYQAKAHAQAKWPVNRPHRNPEWYEVKKQFANYIGLRKKLWGLRARGCGISSITGRSSIWRNHPRPRFTDRTRRFGTSFLQPVRPRGEGHLEVGKNVYYTIHKALPHVLALKPFGCMPSSQLTEFSRR